MQTAGGLYDIDDELYHIFVDEAIEAGTVEDFFHRACARISQCPISWSRLCRTLNFFADSLDSNDAEVLNFDIAAIKQYVRKLGEPMALPATI